MMRNITRTAIAASLLFTTACSQPAAKVDLRGQNTYGRNSTVSDDGNRNNRSYAIYRESRTDSYKSYEPAPVYLNTKPARDVNESTQQTASVQSIGVSDLAPPSSAKPARINHWTKKEREFDAKPEPVQSEEVVVQKPQASIVTKPAKPAKFTSAANAPSSYMWPVGSHKVISNFGPKGAGKANDGINIASAEGEPVWAAADGEVVYAGNELAGYGNMVLIKHPGNKTTSYAHLNRSTVDKYDRVKQGDIIGYVGSTGNVKKSQLHFAIRDGKDPVDPRKYLSTNVAGL